MCAAESLQCSNIVWTAAYSFKLKAELREHAQSVTHTGMLRKQVM